MTLSFPSIEVDERYTLEVSPDSSCMLPILRYLQEDVLTQGEGEMKMFWKHTTKYTLLREKYIRGEKPPQCYNV